jgi:tRNA A-37 threonylcarbamoyl transferase component Bud32
VQEIDANALDSRAAEANLAAGRIAPLEIAGARAWLKNFDQPSPPEWHRVQRALAFVSRLQVMRPVPALHGVEGAKNEIAAMRAFEESGARVPKLLWAQGAKILISDIGPTLREEERRMARAGFAGACLVAARELRRIHSHGLVHGRPILRNLTWDAETIGFLDFEERPTNVMPLATAHARDVVLFLSSLGRHFEGQFLQVAFVDYLVGAKPEVERELRRIVGRSALLLKAPFAKSATRRSRAVSGIVASLAAMLRAFETR